MSIIDYNTLVGYNRWWHFFITPKCPNCGKKMSKFNDWQVYAGWMCKTVYACHDCKVKVKS